MTLFLKTIFSKTSSGSNFKWILASFIFLTLFMMYCCVNIFKIHSTILDLEMFGYSASKVSETFAAYGKNGMHFYKMLQIGDIFYPAIVSLFFGSILYKIYKDSSTLIYLLPFLFLLFDYSENIMFWNFRRTFPNINNNLVAVSSILSILKHLSINLMLVFGGINLILNSPLFKKNTP